MNIPELFKSFFKKKAIRRGLANASFLSVGNFISIIMNVFGFIYISTILGPEKYGIYTSVGAYIGLFTIFTLVGYDKVILREGAKDLNNVGKHIEKIFGLKVFITLTTMIFSIVLSLFLPYSNIERIYITIFSFTLIYKSFNGVLRNVFIAAEKMHYNSFLKVLNRLIFIPIVIIFLYLGLGILSLIIMNLVSELIVIIIEYKLTRKFTKFHVINKFKFDKVLFSSAIIFSILSFTGGLATRIDVIMIDYMSNDINVGIYGVAHNIIEQGYMVRNIFAVAFFPLFVRTFKKRSVRWSVIVKLSIFLGLTLLVLTSIASLIARPMVVLVFGSQFSRSGLLLSVLLFHLSLVFFTIPYTNTLQATHNEKLNLKLCWISPSMNILFNIIFFNSFGLVGIAYSTLVSSVISVVVLVIMTYITLKKQGKIIISIPEIKNASTKQ